MNSYTYRVTVEPLTGALGQPVEEPSKLTFTVANHDDLLAIVDRVRTRDLGLNRSLDANESAAMVIGMKLFSEVALVHRKESFFEEIRESLGRFVRELKAKPEAAESMGGRSGQIADGS